MISYEAVDQFTDSDIYGNTDLVLGGDAGASNIPLKALLDRTTYLKNRINSLEDIKVVTGSYSWDVADKGKGFVFTLSDNSTFSLPDPATLRPGLLIVIRTRYSAVKALTIASSKPIFFAGQSLSEMYMHDSEMLTLAAAPNGWEIFHAFGNFLSAGEDMMNRSLNVKNTFIAQGQIVQRSDVPRLRNYSLSLVSSGGTVTDLQWLSDPGSQPVYRGCYSTGNGSSTMRLPDMRSMHWRALDLSRGISTTRLYNSAGGYAKDAILSHAHDLDIDKDDTSQGPDGFGKFASGGGPPEPSFPQYKTKSVGSNENEVKSIGFYPLIRY